MIPADKRLAKDVLESLTRSDGEQAADPFRLIELEDDLFPNNSLRGYSRECWDRVCDVSRTQISRTSKRSMPFMAKIGMLSALLFLTFGNLGYYAASRLPA